MSGDYTRSPAYQLGRLRYATTRLLETLDDAGIDLPPEVVRAMTSARDIVAETADDEGVGSE